MANIEISVATADLGISRMWPCSAITAPAIECGVTPASRYRRYCGVTSHERDIWLCPVHAMIVACGGSACRECVARGGLVSTVRIIRLDRPVRT